MLLSGQRSLVAWELLIRVRFNINNHHSVGIQYLLDHGIVKTVYPLHDGELDHDDDILEDGNINEKHQKNIRQILKDKWACIRSWRQPQPMWLIRRYFGPKFAFYFAWLQFYTLCLVPPSIIGVLCVIYSSFSINNEDLNPISNSICNSPSSNLTICPVCNTHCGFSKLEDSCFLSKIR